MKFIKCFTVTALIAALSACAAVPPPSPPTCSGENKRPINRGVENDQQSERHANGARN